MGAIFELFCLIRCVCLSVAKVRQAASQQLTSKMALPKKKKKLSKQARMKLMEEQAMKALEKRGSGIGGRRNFTLAVNWKEEQYKSAGKM